jgi:hypothetical protein
VAPRTVVRMFDTSEVAAEPGSSVLPETAVLAQVLASLVTLDFAEDDHDRIEQIAWLERISNAAHGTLAAISVEFADSQAAERRRLGVPERRQQRGAAEQLSMARRVSPHQAATDLALAHAWRDRFPGVGAKLRAGVTNAWAARLVVDETKQLDDTLARVVDDRLAPDLESLTAAQAGKAARFHAQQLDPQAYLNRIAKAADDRRVSLRPAPDTMTWLTALLPVKDGVATWARLDRDARTARSAGDPRTLDQLRADLLVDRLTGQPASEPTGVDLQLTLGVDTLLRDGDTPAVLHGYGPVPAPYARMLIGRAGSGADKQQAKAKVWLRRLFTDPVDGSVVDIDSHRRRFDPTLLRFIDARDQTCRMPGCDAPIAHHDHITRHADTGPTSATNAQGTCAAWNQLKDEPGWQVETVPVDAGHTTTNPAVSITTPTNHTYNSTAPPALGRATHPPPETRDSDVA